MCHMSSLFRLVNENEVKQWKEQAEKMRKGEWWRDGVTDGLCGLH